MAGTSDWKPLRRAGCTTKSLTSARTARSLLASGACDCEKIVSLRCAAAPARAVGGATDEVVSFQRGRNSAKASGLT
eukprot:scaffold74942_cov42-Phaeocystis_antarctica.AAC.3